MAQPPHRAIRDAARGDRAQAARLNAKIKQPRFKFLTFVTRHASETTDLMIPARKRKEFLDVVYGSEAAGVRDKVTVGVVDKTYWEQHHYHPGMHAKTLIADDAVAMIGSPNVSQRSFTCDSETAVVLIDDDPSKPGFVQRFRQETWKEFVRTSPPPAPLYQHPWSLPMNVRAAANAHIVTEYKGGDADDLDVAIKKRLDRLTVGGARIVPLPVDELFSLVWDHLLETRVSD